MSTTNYRLDLTFQDTDGKEFNISYNYHNSESTDAQIKTLVQALITNGAMFKRVPVTCVKADKVQLTSTAYDLS